MEIKKITMLLVSLSIFCSSVCCQPIPENDIEKTYYDNGQVAEEWHFKDGKRNGIRRSYYENGQIQDEWNYKDGKKNGIRRSYYENGQLKDDKFYKDDKKIGIRRSYYENGQIQDEWNYKDDNFNGVRRSFYENGQLIVEGKYKEGKENGPAKMFDENGALIVEVNFKDGKVNGPVKSYFERGRSHNEAIDPTYPILSKRISTITQETINRIKRSCDEAYPREMLVRLIMGGGLLTEKGAFGFSDLEVLVDSFDAFLRPEQKFIDLGSGDGRVVFLASLFGVEATGIEFDSSLINISMKAMKKLSEVVDPNKISFIEGDFLLHDLSGYDVFYTYEATNDISGLKKKLINEMNRGSILISNGHNESVPYDKLQLIRKFIHKNEAPISVYKKLY